MKRIFGGMAILLALLLTGSLAYAFTSGSTGADGAFSPTSDTQLQLPPDGVFNFTTVNIPLGVTVTFIKNVANTPVYILATGDVTIAGTINVSGSDAVNITYGQGGPGGFDGGMGGGNGGKGGNGLGPGGGAVSQASGTSTASEGGGGGYGSAGHTSSESGSPAGAGGPTYGNIRIIPLIGGSGGAGGNHYNFYSNSSGEGGGGGGGAILIASSGTIDVTGSILANGGKGMPGSGIDGTSGGGGSGGAIKLIANTISGNGTVSAAAGRGGDQYNDNGGGSGRVRLEANTLTRTANSSPLYTFSDPGPVFVTAIPSIQITSIGGIAVSPNATGSYGTPDVTLPTGTTNPVEVDLSASNIPVGTTITVSVVPQLGTTSSFDSTGLSGTQQSSTATASVNLSSTETCVLMAEATFNIQTAMNYNGEKIVKATVAASLSRGSQVTYITASGKRVPAEKLIASLMK